MLLAHSGDWVTSVIAIAPVAAIAIWLAVITLKDRRRGDEPDESLGDGL